MAIFIKDNITIHNIIIGLVGWMKIIVRDNYKEMSQEAFGLFRESLRDSNVIGFATGNTPKLLYSMISNECRTGNISFKGKSSFNLDEYYPINKGNAESYWSYMEENLFGKIDMDRGRINFPDSMNDENETVRRYLDAYRRYGPVGTQILGIGHNGHIGFNEPGSSRDSGIRIARLSEDTIRRNNTRMLMAVTMGIKEIMESGRIILLASGKEKSEAIKRAVNGGVTEDVPASFMQEHENTILVLDREAASLL